MSFDQNKLNEFIKTHNNAWPLKRALKKAEELDVDGAVFNLITDTLTVHDVADIYLACKELGINTLHLLNGYPSTPEVILMISQLTPISVIPEMIVKEDEHWGMNEYPALKVTME